VPGGRYRPRPWWGEAPEQSKVRAKRQVKLARIDLLGLKSRRAVVYRGQRLGASIGLLIHLSAFMRYTFDHSPGYSGASPHQNCHASLNS
jgi:hypothetical protein